MLVVKDLSLAIKDKIILDHISFACHPKTLSTVIGSNGAGKTSLFQAIAGYIKFSGLITYQDVILNPKLVGFAHDKLVAYPDLTLKDNINFLLGLYKIKDKDYIEQQSKKLKLEPYFDIKLKNLSKGFQQKANLLLTLVSNPQILILDEATSALDNQSESVISEVIQEVSKNKITFIIAHRLSTIKNANKIAAVKGAKATSWKVSVPG